MRVTLSQDERTKIVSICLLGALAGIGCSSDSGLGEHAAALTAQNGLTTNALTRNALTRNALTRNALTRNALTRNALTRNALTRNSLTLTADALDTLVQGGATADEIAAERELRAASRKLVEYVYSCAMPAGSSVSLDFSTDGTDGSTCDGGTLSADGLTCSYGTLTGELGLAPAWGTDVCDESCQRWVSSCVLARTNYWGVRVDLSLRGSHPALQASEAEKAEYPLREGTYFGNIFTETSDAAGNAVYAPEYHACGGPGSNVPMVTKRFCSSSAADCVIDVGPSCACTEVAASAYPQGYFTAFGGDTTFMSVGLSFTCQSTERSCAGAAADGAMTDCFSGTGSAYPESVTVFLRNAAICGNGVCESGEDAQSCSNDCRPGVWATRYSTIAETYATGLAGLSDDSLVLAGVNNTWEPVDLGDGNIFPIATSNTAKPFLGRMATDGSYMWSRRLTPTTANTYSAVETPLTQIAASAGDQILVGGDAYDAVSGSPSSNIAREAWVMSLTKAGTVAWQRSFVTGERGYVVRLVGVDTDATGNVMLAGSFTGDASFGGTTLIGTGREDIYVVKLGPDGSHVWSHSFGSAFPSGAAAQDLVNDMDVDGSGNTLVVACYERRCDWVGKFGPDGTLLWSKHVGTTVDRIVADAAGNVYVTGTLVAPFDFGGGPLGGTVPAMFVAKYAADGTFASAQIAVTGESAGSLWAEDLVADVEGNILVAGGFTRMITGAETTYDAGAYSDIFLAKVTPAGTSWLKQFGGPLQEFFGGVVAANGRIAVAGDLQASILFEQTLLAASVAAPPAGASYWGDVFLGSFPDPTSTVTSDACAFVSPGSPCVDREPPVMTMPAATATDASTGLAGPVVEQTASWMTVDHLVTAIDDVDGPVAVDCRRLDSPMQPLTEVSPTALDVVGRGWSYMVCTATDAAGNTTRRRFTLLINDTTPPTITTPSALIVDATSNTGANVAYQVTMTDTIELVSSSCSPSPGAFPLGPTTVWCQASDRASNTSTASFPVNVRYAWSGFSSPSAGQTFTRGTTIKVAFALTGGSAAIVNASGQLYYAPVVNGVVGTETLSGTVSYSRRSGYSASLATRKLAVGTYRLRVDLRDGVLRTIQIKLI